MTGPRAALARWGDLLAAHLPGDRVHVVGRQLLPVDIQSACDRGHRDLLMLRG